MQFKSLNNTTRAEFLLRVDERYASIEIIEARAIIHEYYNKTYTEDIDITSHVKKIGELIIQAEQTEEPKRFIQLLNFLDFLETVSYFTNNYYMSLDDVNELIGGSLKYYYCAYQAFIAKRRSKYHCDKYYCEIEKLAKKVQKSNPGLPPIINL